MHRAILKQFLNIVLLRVNTSFIFFRLFDKILKAIFFFNCYYCLFFAARFSFAISLLWHHFIEFIHFTYWEIFTVFFPILSSTFLSRFIFFSFFQKNKNKKSLYWNETKGTVQIWMKTILNLLFNKQKQKLFFLFIISGFNQRPHWANGYICFCLHSFESISIHPSRIDGVRFRWSNFHRQKKVIFISFISRLWQGFLNNDTVLYPNYFEEKTQNVYIYIRII